MPALRLSRAAALAAAAGAAALQLAFPAPAHALEGPTADVALHGDYRLRAVWLADLPLDAAGTLLGQSAFAEHRLRISPEIRFRTFEFHGELDLFDGPFAGDASIDFVEPIRARDRVTPIPRGKARYLWAVWNAPVARLQAGLMGSRWGLGLLASDGTGQDDDFGDDFYGDRSLRVLVATRPLLLASKGKSTRGAPLALVVAADLVLEDETARYSRGDRAYEGVAALLWSEGADGKPAGLGEGVREAGAYLVYRSLTDAAGGKLGVLAADVYGRLVLARGPDRWTFAAEAVVLAGQGTVARSLSAPDGHSLLAAGAVVRAEHERGRVGAVLELGWASGDASTDDDKITSFKFDPDYNVGLLMFDEAVAWQSARSADLLADPDLVGVPPNGVALLPTNGSVTNALYANWRGKLRPTEKLELVLGLLTAVAPYPVVDPYNTFRNGGVPQNYLGGAPGRFYGVETDLALRWKVRLPKFGTFGDKPSAWTLQGGWMVPGNVFRDASSRRMPQLWEVVLRLWLAW
jgi:hypothetical protein